MRKPRIHQEGRRIIIVNSLLWLVVAALFFIFCSNLTVNIIVAVFCLGIALFMLRFFRVPEREALEGDNLVIAPGDGRVVDIREVVEDEFFHSKCIRISIFLSVFDVHVTWAPVSGKVTYYNYHPGKYLIAFHPKASELNERTSIGIMTDSGHPMMFRQIAGILARRIVCYAREGERLEQASQAGFIKFGSRIDLFLPLDTEILVKKGDDVTGLETALAHFKH
ncbi:MAG: phosphatidylserine decarboxylase family protein [Bacteroidales bacterium]|nr:phosphatidylserine decarboxylase family protein [Bacteroidales bacterium]